METKSHEKDALEGWTRAAVVLLTSSSAFAQLATANINATAVVALSGRITLTGTINFPQTIRLPSRQSTLCR